MFRDMGFEDPSSLDAMVASSRPMIRDGLENGGYRAWLVETAAGQVVAGGGIVLVDFQSTPADPQPLRAWVVNLFTEPEHRRCGLARRLMELMMDWCRGRGMRTLYLHSSEDGRRLYEDLGFTQTPEMKIEL
jgi:GNAT superfamily N-acetyltransferase